MRCGLEINNIHIVKTKRAEVQKDTRWITMLDKLALDNIGAEFSFFFRGKGRTPSFPCPPPLPLEIGP